MGDSTERAPRKGTRRRKKQEEREENSKRRLQELTREDCYISHITKLRRNQTRTPVILLNRYTANHSHNAPERP